MLLQITFGESSRAPNPGRADSCCLTWYSRLRFAAASSHDETPPLTPYRPQVSKASRKDARVRGHRLTRQARTSSAPSTPVHPRAHQVEKHTQRVEGGSNPPPDRLTPMWSGRSAEISRACSGASSSYLGDTATTLLHLRSVMPRPGRDHVRASTQIIADSSCMWSIRTI